MDRTPTSLHDRWVWWERAVAGERFNVHVHDDNPQCGFFKIRKFPYGLWPRGPWIPARIWVESGEVDPDTNQLLSDEKWLAEIDGKKADPWKVWLWNKHPITEEEFEWLTALSPLNPNRIPANR